MNLFVEGSMQVAVRFLVTFLSCLVLSIQAADHHRVHKDQIPYATIYNCMNDVARVWVEKRIKYKLSSGEELSMFTPSSPTKIIKPNCSLNLDLRFKTDAPFLEPNTEVYLCSQLFDDEGWESKIHGCLVDYDLLYDIYIEPQPSTGLAE